MPKDIHVIVSDADHKILKERKDAQGLTWRDVIFKVLNLEASQE